MHTPTPASISRKLHFLTWVMEFFSLSVLVFMRREVGLRIVQPARFLTLSLFLMLGIPTTIATINFFIHRIPFIGGSLPWLDLGPLTELVWLGVAILVAGSIQRHLSWVAFLDGKEIWGRSLGISHLSFLPVRLDRINRFIEPAFCFSLGWLANQRGLYLLGPWLQTSAFALFMAEQQHFEAVLASEHERRDAIALPRMQARLIRDLETSHQRKVLHWVARPEKIAAARARVTRFIAAHPLQTLSFDVSRLAFRIRSGFLHSAELIQTRVPECAEAVNSPTGHTTFGDNMSSAHLQGSSRG